MLGLAPAAIGAYQAFLAGLTEPERAKLIASQQARQELERMRSALQEQQTRQQAEVFDRNQKAARDMQAISMQVLSQFLQPISITSHYSLPAPSVATVKSRVLKWLSDGMFRVRGLGVGRRTSSADQVGQLRAGVKVLAPPIRSEIDSAIFRVHMRDRNKKKTLSSRTSRFNWALPSTAALDIPLTPAEGPRQ